MNPTKRKAPGTAGVERRTTSNIQFKGIPDNLSGHLQDNALTLLVMSEQYCEEAMDLIKPELFSNRVIRDIVEKAHRFITKHGKPPGQHIADMLDKKLHGEDEDEAELYRSALENINTIWTDRFNEEYVRGTLLHFAALQEMKLVTMNLIEASEKGDLDHGHEVIAQGAAGREAYEQGIGVGVQLIRGDTVAVDDHDWRWPGYLAAREFHVLAGPPGTGKSTVALNFAATMTRTGIRWPDNTRNIESLPVLIWSGEDDVSTTLAPRLRAMGADMRKVFFLSTVVEENAKRSFDPARDMGMLTREASKIGRIGMLILDPIVSAVAGDSHKNAEVRRGLQPVVDFARRHECVLLGVTHYTKGTQGKDPVERVTGSLAFGAIPRMVLVAARVPLLERDADAEDSRAATMMADRMLVRAKSNIGPTGGGFYFRLERRAVPGKKELEAQAVQWQGVIDGEAHAILASAEKDKPMRPSEFLRGLLANGEMEAKAVFKAAEAEGYSQRQMQDAATHLKVDRDKPSMDGGWLWKLPGQDAAATD